MGELHLDIYAERMKREYNVACVTGKPRVAFRETITQRADFSYTHKKQTGGAGQFGRVIGYIEPMDKDEETGKDTAFENYVIGGNIPIGYIPAVEKVLSACIRMDRFVEDFCPPSRYRAFATPSRKGHYRVILSQVADLFCKMALIMPSTPRN